MNVSTETPRRHVLPTAAPLHVNPATVYTYIHVQWRYFTIVFGIPRGPCAPCVLPGGRGPGRVVVGLTLVTNCGKVAVLGCLLVSRQSRLDPNTQRDVHRGSYFGGEGVTASSILVERS
jgi:hypothetical protein